MLKTLDLDIDVDILEKELGVKVVPTVATQGEGVVLSLKLHTSLHQLNGDQRIGKLTTTAM